MLFALDIGVNKKAPATHIVHWRLNSLTSKTSFAKSPLKPENYPSPLLGDFAIKYSRF